MIILVLDSCGPSCGVCVWQDGTIRAEKTEKMERGQDARLMPMVVETLAQAGITFQSLDRIAVTRGPGSFTGVRVGLAAARGIGLASNKPVIGIDRFSIYRALNPAGNLLAIIASKRAELFCQYFPAATAPHPPCMMTPQEIDAFLAAHSDIVRKGDAVEPDQNILSACAALAAKADAQDPAYEARPLYLRAPDVTLPAAKSR